MSANRKNPDSNPRFGTRHLHPLQAANCCRNSRLVEDEDDSFTTVCSPYVIGIRKLSVDL